jgi:hypothetical protein
VDAATLLMSSSPSVSGNCKPLAEESLDILSGGFELGPASILRDTIAFLGDVVSEREVFGGHLKIVKIIKRAARQAEDPWR